ncbi:MAG: sulfatase, partial [Coraliomargarita sp.]
VSLAMILSGVLFANALFASEKPDLAVLKKDQPNILFIVFDDLSILLPALDYDGIETPNLDRLFNRGMFFNRAYANAPLCGPSRTSFMFGLHPTSTGEYGNHSDYRKNPSRPLSWGGYLKNNGYTNFIRGKIYQNRYIPYEEWDEAVMYDKDDDAEKVDAYENGFARCAKLKCGDEGMDDYQMTTWAVEHLKQSYDKPFLLGVGLHTTHGSKYAPEKYFKDIPLDTIKLPELHWDDLDDLPERAKAYAKSEREFMPTYRDGKFPEMVQGYLATLLFTDAQVGRILDALEEGGHADNTIVMAWSDHSIHHGQKLKFAKNSLWRWSVQVPFSISVPGMTQPNSRSNRAVQLLDIYPTISELAGLPVPEHCEGTSLVPLLRDPEAPWSHPVVTVSSKPIGLTYAVRTEKWAYLKYVDEGEELYDLEKDPDELTNLLYKNSPEYQPVVERLKKHIPANPVLPPSRAKNLR